MTIREVAGELLPDLVLTSILLHAVEESFPEFSLLVEIQLSDPLTKPAQKTFEYAFGRFRAEFYRQKARHRRGGSSFVALVQREPCNICGRTHGKVCWTKSPELAPPERREFFEKLHKEWKAKTQADTPTIG